MATTLLQPRLRICKWVFTELDVQEYEKGMEVAINEIRSKAVSETLKITWVALGEKALLCIIEWCEWATD